MEEKLSLLQSINQPTVPAPPKSYSTTIAPVEISGVSKLHPESLVPVDEDEDLLEEDDFEAAAYLNTAEEASIKGVLWEKINAEYLAEQELRKSMEEGKKTPRPRRRGRNGAEASLSPAQAAVEMLRRRVSTKINYEALNTLFDTSTDNYAVNSNAAGGAVPISKPFGAVPKRPAQAQPMVAPTVLPGNAASHADDDDFSPPGTPTSTFGMTGLSEADQLALGYRGHSDDDESFF